MASRRTVVAVVSWDLALAGLERGLEGFADALEPGADNFAVRASLD